LLIAVLHQSINRKSISATYRTWPVWQCGRLDKIPENKVKLELKYVLVRV